jgi:hypothetical protein
MLCTRIDEVLFVSFIVKKLTYKDCGTLYIYYIYLYIYIYIYVVLKLNILLRTFYMLKLNFNKL